VLPEFRFVQEDAEFIGGELSALIELRHDERTDIDLELFGDIVRAELRDTGDYLPRIPPASYGIALRYRGPRWYASGSIRHTDRQDRLAPSEMLDSPLVEGEELIGGPTAAFTMVDATVGIRLIEGHRMHEVSLIGRNLTDEEGRVHSSRTKNVAPLPGADIALTYRLVF
jgi:iron complex outermembrane receptor protein